MDHDFWRRVAENHSVLTTASGVAAFGRSGFYRRVRAGQFVALHRGVWRVAGSQATERQRLRGLSIAVRALASFRSTLALCGVPGQTLARPELTIVGTGFPSRNLLADLGDASGVRIHRTNFLPASHTTLIDAIPSTTLARALCDVSAVMSIERLGRLVDSCKRLQLISYDDLALCREDIRARGRRKTTYLDEVLSARIAGWVVGESPPEDIVRKWLEEVGYEPTAQHWVVANGRRRRLDFALVADRVAIEYFGLAEHATASSVADDSEKITDLQLAGWLVVIVTKKTTKYEFLRNVAEMIRRRSLSPP